MEEVRNMFSYYSERKQTAMLGTAYGGGLQVASSNWEQLPVANQQKVRDLSPAIWGIEFCQQQNSELA